jgi:transcriptional regulator with XRE-family HTH domain
MTDNINELFGSRLKALREAKALRQEDVGDLFKMKKSTVSQWESGRLPHATIISELASYFDVTVDYLLGRTNERKPGSGVKAIDNPEVTDFMKTVVGEFRLDPNLTPKDQQEIIEDLAEYFRFKMQQKKNQRQNY